MEQRPNLLFIMPDQLRPDFLSCYGADFIETPHMDSLASRGVRFERAYSTSPLCVPARASLLTGLNALRTGVTDNGQWLRPDYQACGLRTWPELLAEQGYYTAAVGKMHFYPWDIVHGFQYRVAAEDKRWIKVRDDYDRFLRRHGYRKLHGNEHPGYHENKGAVVSLIPWAYSVDHFVGQESVDFIRRHGREGPFAMMVGFPGPHCPYDPTPEYLDGVDPEAMPPAIPDSGIAPALRRRNIEANRQPWNGVDYTEFTPEHKRKIRAHYAALVKQIDDEVGAILAALEEQGQLDNTVIIFASDHGDYLGDHDLIGKGTFYESSIHIPLILAGPGVDGPQVNDELVALTDVTATLLHLAGADLPPYLDARPLPGAGADRTPHELLYGMVSDGWMAYDGRWKLCKYGTGDLLLFDLEDDPTEQVNRLRDPDCREVLLRLDALLSQELMRSMRLANEDRRVYTNSLFADPGFGMRGWQRRYPKPLEGNHA